MWTNSQKIVDLLIFAKEVFNGKLHFLCNVFSNLPTKTNVKPEKNY